MYDDPKHLRNNEIKVRINWDTKQAVIAFALAHMTQKQPAAFIRDLVVDEIKRRLEASPNDVAIGSR